MGISPQWTSLKFSTGNVTEALNAKVDEFDIWSQKPRHKALYSANSLFQRRVSLPTPVMHPHHPDFDTFLSFIGHFLMFFSSFSEKSVSPYPGPAPQSP